MKKFKTLTASMILLALVCLSVTPQLSNAQGNPPPDGKQWICCQSLTDDGCTAMDGTHFETDYRLDNEETCP